MPRGPPCKGPTQLELACRAGDYDAVESLLKFGENPNKGAVGPLYESALKGCERSVQLLLLYGASPDGRRPYHPISAAAISRSTPIMRMLLENGASPNKRDHEGKLPLHRVAEQPGGSAMLRLLFEFGCRVAGIDSKGETALFPAVRCGDVEQATLICEMRAGVANILNKEHKHAFEYATSRRVASLARSYHRETRRRCS